MVPDPRWLEILKASGWQTAALALAFAAFLWAGRTGWLPPLEIWMVQLAGIAMFICGLLSIASFISGAIERGRSAWERFDEARALKHSLETLNSAERQFLDAQVEKGETTTYLHPFNARSIPNFVQLSNIYQGLQAKNVVEITAADPEGKIQSVRITHQAWNLLLRRRKKPVSNQQD